MDSNHRSPEERGVYSAVQLPLCDTPTLAERPGLKPRCPEGTFV